ncbi:MAG: hypothetical protein WCI56_12675 [Hyphomicrobiales bacterium]
MSRFRIALSLFIAAVLAVAACYVVPRGLEAESLLAVENDPARMADRELDRGFTPEVAAREIEAALAAKDADLARSFVELAEERKIAVAPALTEKVVAASVEAASASHAAESFARGLVTGEPDDVVGLAGTALGDLFVFGDIRDAVREGTRYATGEKVDEVVLGLACVGLAVTAGTYATFGAAAPARVGLSLAKAARKTERLSAGMAEWIGRSLRQVVDWDKLKAAIVGATLSDPAIAVRAAREAVKVERAGGLMQLVRNVGRVQSKAGTQAALDGLKIAEGPREMARVAALAEAKGGKTRAILKSVGRGALVLSVATFDLGIWVLGALLTLFALVSSTKGAVERMTLRSVRRRKERRLAEQQARFAAMVARG